MEGPLCKWTNYATGWKKRWFILEHGALSYYKIKDEKYEGLRGSIQLRDAKILPSASDRRLFSITDRHSLFFRLKAETPQERDDWIKALDLAKLSTTHQRSPSYALSPTTGTFSIGAPAAPLAAISSGGESAIAAPHGLLPAVDPGAEIKNTALLSLQSFTKLVDLLASEAAIVADNRLQKYAEILRSTSSSLSEMVGDLHRVGLEQRQHWATAYEEEHRRRLALEKSLEALAHENNVFENKAAGKKGADATARENSLSGEAAETSTSTSISETFDAELDDLDEAGEPQQFFDAPEAAMSQDVYAVGYPAQRRTKLPVARRHFDLSAWSIIKDAIGSDLTRITVPIFFNEPLSVVQRMAEDVEYAPLLDRAVACDDSLERIMYVAAFAVSNYTSSSVYRTAKPFNSLLGETYELVRPDLGFRFVCEQVSHHPVCRLSLVHPSMPFSNDSCSADQRMPRRVRQLCLLERFEFQESILGKVA